MWVGLIQSVKAWQEQKRTFSEKEEEFCQHSVFELEPHSINSSWVSSMSIYLEDFVLSSLHNCMSQSLKIHPSIILSTYMHMYTHTYTHIQIHITHTHTHILLVLFL